MGWNVLQCENLALRSMHQSAYRRSPRRDGGWINHLRDDAGEEQSVDRKRIYDSVQGDAESVIIFLGRLHCELICKLNCKYKVALPGTWLQVPNFRFDRVLGSIDVYGKKAR